MQTKKDIIDCAKNVLIQEGNALITLASELDTSLSDIVELIFNCNGRLIISGIGKSAIVAQKMVATFNSTGTPAIFLHAAEALHGDLGTVQSGDIILIISKSGESPEIRNLVNILSTWDNQIVSIVNKKTSYLAEKSYKYIYANCEEEACPNNLAPTTSTTIQMAIGDALAVCLMQMRDFGKSDFARLHPGGNLGKRLLLTLDDIYPNNPQPFVYTNTLLKDILNNISQGRMGAVAVVDENQIVIGIITDGDIRRLLQHVDNITNINAQDFYSKNPKTILGNTLAIDALERMRKNDISQLIVTEKNGKFLGFVHLHDLIREGLG